MSDKRQETVKRFKQFQHIKGGGRDRVTIDMSGLVYESTVVRGCYYDSVREW